MPSPNAISGCSFRIRAWQILTALVVLAGIGEAGSAEGSPTISDTGNPKCLAGSQSVTAAATLPDSSLQAVRQRLAMVVGPSETGTLASGLRELARRDARFSIPTAEGMDGRRLAAGVAHFAIGTLRVDSRAKSLSHGAVGKRFPTTPNSIVMQLSARDLDDGRFVHDPEDDLPKGTLTITGQNSQVRRWRKFNVANSGTTNFPLTVPELSLTKVQTTVVVPLGGVGFSADWDAALADLSANTNVRDPEIAWNIYRQSMECVERTWPAARVIWTTMPLAASRNTLRNCFNAQVRSFASAHGRPLLDIAAIQSTGEDGKMAIDAEGERSSVAWATTGGLSRLNLEGAVRVAQAWWWLQAKLPDGPTAARDESAGKPTP